MSTAESPKNHSSDETPLEPGQEPEPTAAQQPLQEPAPATQPDRAVSPRPMPQPDAASEPLSVPDAPVEADYPLALPDGEPAAGENQNSDLPAAPPPVWVPEPAVPTPFQFSLAELLGLVIVLAMLLGIIRALSRHWAAFVFGLIVFFSLAWIKLARIERPIVHVGWWAMLVTYILTCIAALMGGGN